MPCPYYTVGGRLSSYTMTWLPYWGKPHYVWTDNGAEFVGSFAQLCKGLGIIHHHITIGNSKANRQVKRMIRTLKDCIRCGLTKMPATF